MSNQITKIEPTVPAVVTPGNLLEIAVQQNADIEKLEKLMDLQMRWEKSEAKKAYVTAMSRFREVCPTIDKTRNVSFGKTNYSHAGLAETIEQIKGVMTDHGLSHSWRTGQENGGITVTCCVTHVQGHQECTSLSAGADNSGGKNSIQAVASTVTYLERYTLFAILGLASKEQDTDGNIEIEHVNEQQAAHIRELLKKSGKDEAKYLAWQKIDCVESTLAIKYQGIVKGLSK